MEPLTPITPLEPGVEMFQRGRPQSFFPIDAELANRLSVVQEMPSPTGFLAVPQHNIASANQRPVSQITEFIEDEDEDEYDEEYDYENYGDGSEFEEDSAEELSFESNEGRRSQTTISTLEEVHTPLSGRRMHLSQLDSRRSVEGPRGPHLFRASTASSEFSSDHALQMSPLLPQKHQMFSMLSQLQTDKTPTTIITRSPVRWLGEDPMSWSAQQVTIWMEDIGIEDAIIEKFKCNDITGTVLLDLQFQDLKELGIQSFGKRHQLWTQIGTLRENDGGVSPVPTPFLDTTRSTAGGDAGKEDLCGGFTPITPGGRRRRRKVRRNGDEPITPAESVSIVAIEQLLPKPHKCAKGENCLKWRKQQRLLRRLHEEHGFPISPEAGGRIFMAGNPGNPELARNIIGNTLQVPMMEQRPLSESEPSVVGPSVVASSDILGPGEMPEFSLDEIRLRQLEEQDPQENVKNFLSLQHVDPSHMLPPMEDHIPESPITGINAFKIPSDPPAPLSHLQSLPRLDIPQSAPIHHTTQIQATVAANNFQYSMDDTFSPCRTAAASPLQALYRFGTPASDMDLPVTTEQVGAVSRDASQSVPPNMYLRDPVIRASSRSDWRRPSMQLPPLAEGEIFDPSNPSLPPSDSSTRRSSDAAHSDAASSHVQIDGPASSKTSVSEAYDPRFPNVNHSGWMKKRKTKLLRHEWHEHHFRLSDSKLTMHRNDLPASSPLDTLNIDNYAVACSSVASNKLSAKLKALKIKEAPHGKDTATQAKDAAFSFQLIPTTHDGEEPMKLKKAIEGKKTHHFAVKTRDERIDWMRELMLAKALKAKGEGYSIEVNGTEV